jgi:hypothetical protein
VADPASQYLQEALGKAAKGGESAVGHAAIVEALRLVGETMSRIADRQDILSGKMAEQGETLHAIDKRLAVFENNSLTSTVKSLEARVSALELTGARQQGAVGVGEWLTRNWIAIVALLGSLAIVIKVGVLRL